MTLSEAKEVLRIDTDDNDEIIASLLVALPDYIEVKTGLTAAQQEAEPLVKTVSGFIITLWYYSDHADDVKLQRTIKELLHSIRTKAGGGSNG